MVPLLPVWYTCLPAGLREGKSSYCGPVGSQLLSLEWYLGKHREIGTGELTGRETESLIQNSKPRDHDHLF